MILCEVWHPSTTNSKQIHFEYSLIQSIILKDTLKHISSTLLFLFRCSNKDITETVRSSQSSLEIPGHEISSIYASKQGPATPVHVTTDAQSSSSVQALQSSFQNKLGNIQNLVISA